MLVLQNIIRRNRSGCSDKSKTGSIHIEQGPAFTLIELLVSISIIAILAGMVLVVIAKGKARGSEVVCLNNTKQLGLAMTLYVQDNGDLFPAPGSRSFYGPQPEDWIHWQHGRDINKSSIVPYVSRFNPDLFTCRADREAIELQSMGTVPGDPFRYSYSFTSYPVTSNINGGLSTIITKDRKVYPFKASSVKQPSQKIMIVEEDRATIDDPRWVPMGTKTNLIANRHGRQGYVVFVDGHVQKVLPTFGMSPFNNDPLK